MQQEKFIIASKMDKTPLSVLMVTPDGAPKGLVQFSHGMAEHKERYLRVMCLLAAEGYASTARACARRRIWAISIRPARTA